MKKALGLLLAIVAVYFINGFVISKMWAWFIVPTFGAPQLSIPVAIGIGMLIAMLAKNNIEKKEKESLLVTIGIALLSPLMTLLIAWIVYQFA
jgi:hypothetical protein